MGDYFIGSDGELYHYGVKGMKWGVRRYQRRDGSLTAAGKKRVAERAGRYLDPDGEGSSERQAVASTYKKFSVNGETLNHAEGYLWSYSNATLRDLGLREDPKARSYVEDIFRADPKMKALSAARDAADAEREKQAISDLSKMSPNDQKQVRKIMDKFSVDKWGDYTSVFSKNIDGDDIEIEIDTRKGTETFSAVTALKFLKKYDPSIAREGVAKEYYDGPWSWVSDPDSDNYYPRDEFKRRISPSNINIKPHDNTYETLWDDDGTYGWHVFIDEGSMEDMKVRYRSLQG